MFGEDEHLLGVVEDGRALQEGDFQVHPHAAEDVEDEEAPEVGDHGGEGAGHHGFAGVGAVIGLGEAQQAGIGPGGVAPVRVGVHPGGEVVAHVCGRGGWVPEVVGVDPDAVDGGGDVAGHWRVSCGLWADGVPFGRGG